MVFGPLPTWSSSLQSSGLHPSPSPDPSFRACFTVEAIEVNRPVVLPTRDFRTSEDVWVDVYGGERSCVRASFIDEQASLFGFEGFPVSVFVCVHGCARGAWEKNHAIVAGASVARHDFFSLSHKLRRLRNRIACQPLQLQHSCQHKVQSE